MGIMNWLAGKKRTHRALDFMHPPWEQIGREASEWVQQAVGIVNTHVDTNPVFHVRDSGDSGSIMAAAEMLQKALALEPGNIGLRYAHTGLLRLAAQFGAADAELAELLTEHPDYTLAKCSQEVWHEAALIAPSPLAYPEWNGTCSTLPPFFRDKLSTFTVLPARDGIHPRPVLFEKDNDGWWTPEKLEGAQTEIAVVLIPGSPNMAAVYRRTSGPGLAKPDIQEALVVLDTPRNDLALVGWIYLADGHAADAAITDRHHNVIFNQRITLTPQAREPLASIKKLLLNTPGREVSHQEILSAIQRYQGASDLNEIEQNLFRRR